MDNLSKALALARIGVKVFPVDTATRSPFSGTNGFYQATSDDIEQIATWFTEYPDSTTEVAYWTGGSGLFVADVDKKNGKDGFARMAERDLSLGSTHSYPTRTNGEHHVYASLRDDLTLSRDYDGIEGLDIRAGGSYAVWWADEVPDSRDVFSTEIPEWLTKVADKAEFEGEGFLGSIDEWLEAIPDEPLPSSRVVHFMSKIPEGDFGHPEMVDLAWGVVRMGSERETGVRLAINALRTAWLRDPYDTPKNRRDLNVAIQGAINKGGRVQKPVPSIAPLSTAFKNAAAAGVDTTLKQIERRVSETATEAELARLRREMFKSAAEAGLAPSSALGVVTGSKSFKNARASIESVWFGDGEPFYNEIDEAALASEEETLEVAKADHEEELKKLVTSLAADAQGHTYLTEAEQALVASPAYEWWGSEYLNWVQTRLKHFNAPYHTGAMWAAISVIASPWGKVPLQGHKPTDCNLYINVLGDSSSGKSEAWGFGKGMIDAYYGVDPSPIIGDVKKSSALAMHRSLILRDGEPTLVYSDEVQGFFQDLQQAKWQGSILADLSDVYGGEVPPKNTMNDKDISGKRASSLLTTYLTGIADMSLDAISIDHWRSGLFYRFLWGFGFPRKSGDFSITMETVATSYTTEFETWAREFKRLEAYQSTLWGPGRIVQWEEPARKRMEKFAEQIDKAAQVSPLYETVFIPANGRFLISMMKAATLVALLEASEKVTLKHVLIALSFSGPWHRSMMLAVAETGKDAFEREVDKAYDWITRNAIVQVGKPPFIQRSTFMRAFKPNEIADRLLRQLTEEGRLVRGGDIYQLHKE